MSKSIEITVREIFDFLRNGDNHRGVNLLYKYHYNKMFGIAFSIVKKEDISQDIVHNVIYKLLQLETDKFPISSELTWLYSVVKNEALIFLRKEKSYFSIDDIAQPIIEDKNIHDFVDMDSFYSMIKNLNEEQKQIVTLKVLGGYTHKEIGSMLNKPIGTIQWIYNTSVKKLKTILSSLLVAIFATAFGLTQRIVEYIGKSNTLPESPDQTIHQIPFDYSIVIFAGLCIAFILIFLIVYIKSYKIPTKAERKSI